MDDVYVSLRITQIVQETSDARSYWFEPTHGQPITFRPGQFLTLLIPFNGYEARRSYSLSSLPAEGLRITIKRVPNGAISRYLLDSLRVGDLLTSLLPAGRFTLDSAPQKPPRDILLFGAGSGITPLFALLRQVLLEEPQSHVTLLYSNTRPSGVLFRQELAELNRRHPDRFTLLHLLSQGEDSDADLGGTVRVGRLNNTLLESLLPALLRYEPSQAQVFICGPTDYMRMVQFTLLVLGLRAEQIRRENFIVEPVRQAPAPVVAQDRTMLLYRRGQAIKVTVPASVSILQAALDAGVSLPYSCRGGRCSTCAARCTSGRVLMTINDVLTDRDLAEGWVLTCTGYPETDGVVIEV